MALVIPTAPAACSYELNAQLHLVAADSAFATFALANGAPELVPPAPLGRSIVSFISDPATAQLYAELFRRVAAQQMPVTVRLRCDSPTLRRYLTLTISPRTGGYRLTSRVELVEERPPQSLLVARPGAASDQLLRVCSWCKRVDVHGQWCEVEDAVTELVLFEEDVPPQLTHTMCEACYQEIRTLTVNGPAGDGFR